MTRNNQPRFSRRQYLTVAGTGAALGIAGCLGDDDENGGNGGDDGNGGNGGNGGDGGNGSGDDFPTDDITLTVPYSTGGGYDTYARLAAPYIGDELGVNVNVENVEGAGGQIAADQIARAEPDGYSMMVWNSMGFARRELLEDTAFATAEMTYYGQIAEDTQSIGVSPDTGIETVDEFVDAVQNEELTFGTQGMLNDGVINPLLLGRNTGLYDEDKVLDNVVVYEGTSAAVNGMIRGDVDVIGANVFSLLPFQEAGDVRLLLALRTFDESPLTEDQAPNLETLATADVPEAESVEAMTTNIRAFAGPPEVPEDRVSTIADAIEAALTNDELLQEAEDADNPITYQGRSDTQEAVTQAYQLWEENEDLLNRLAEADQ